MGWCWPGTFDRAVGCRSPWRLAYAQKPRRSRNDFSHRHTTQAKRLVQTVPGRSSMKKGLEILIAVGMIGGLTWAYFQLKEGGFRASYPARPESPAPIQALGTSFA